MRLSYQWLRDLVDGVPAPTELARRLTAGGIEVEALVLPAKEWGDRLVVARIDRKEQHPNADRLTVCTVDDGTGEPRTIVCGARNHASGDTVVLARPGCELPGGLTIKRSKLRGVDSDGMLCSASEVGLSDATEGILILEAGLEPGTPAAPLLGLDDTVLELGITPNRGDCLGMRGLAREVAALCNLPLRAAPPVLARPEGPSSVPVEIRDTDACPLYHGLVMRGVRVGPSPTWLRTRLAAAGLRSINNVVDVTNLVLLETGQPMHAFDLARLRGGRVVVRRAEEGERIVTLDGRDVALRPADLVIADAVGPVAVAGVMGGAESAVQDGTTDLFLEAALFAPATVRRTARHHGLLTDSSHRFERGVDTAGVETALLRAAWLLRELAGANPDGGLVVAGPGVPARAPVRVRPSRVAAIVGVELAGDVIEGFLRAVGCEPRRDGDAFVVTPPTSRHDLAREIDFIEEVARLHGYDAIPASMPSVTMGTVEVPAPVAAAREIRSRLAALGLAEHVAVSFASEADNARFPGLLPEAASVQVRNPLRADATALQRSPLGALLAALRANVAVQQPRVDLFAIARVFAGHAEQGAVQTEVVAGLLHGPRPGSRPGESRPVVLADAKAVVEQVLAILVPGAKPVYEAISARPEYHPRAAAGIRVGGGEVGFVGRLHPDVAEDLEIAGEIYLFEVDCRGAVQYRRAHPGLLPIPRFPSSERDVSLLVSVETPSAAAIRLVEGMNEPFVESVELFDEYSGTGIEDGCKALGYRFVYRAPDRTLTDAEVGAVHDRVLGHLTGRLGARVRV